MNSPIFLLAENEDYAFYRVKSFTNPEKDYGIDIDKVECTVFCDCPHFINRLQTEKWGGAKLNDTSHHCKHIQEVLRWSFVNVSITK